MVAVDWWPGDSEVDWFPVRVDRQLRWLLYTIDDQQWLKAGLRYGQEVGTRVAEDWAKWVASDGCDNI